MKAVTREAPVVPRPSAGESRWARDRTARSRCGLRPVQHGGHALVGALRSAGLIGWGQRTVPPRIPSWMRERPGPRARGPGDGPAGGDDSAGEFDPAWQRGPMGDWVRRYRPDLMGH
ncbi:hypothetical protein GCM10027203_40570 [Nonomuraea fastidiosa]